MRSCFQIKRGSCISRVLTDEKSTVTATDEEMDHIGILSVDPGLEPHKDHFKHRVRRYADQVKLFQKHEGGLEEFAKGGFFLPFSCQCRFSRCSWLHLTHANL